VRAHPIVRAGALLIAFRIGSLAIRYATQSSGSLGSRLALFLPAAAMHAGVLLLVIAAFLVLAWWLPRASHAVMTVACAAFAILMVAGLADLIVSTITGAPLTPTVFRTYRGIRVVRSNEFLEPLRAHAASTLAGAVVFAGVVVSMTRIAGRNGVRAERSTRSTILVMIVAGAMLCWAPSLAAWPLPPPPIEWAFLREYLDLDRATVRGSEDDAIARLRQEVGLPPGAEWMTRDFPLAYRWSGSRPQQTGAARPDIIVVMVESLRAEDLAFTTGVSDSVTPNLDALATRSVVLPTYISNGFPSAPSVLAFHCSAWPHRRKEIITDFADRGFDCIPPRLKTLGYETVYVGADPNFDNQSQWLSRWYSTTVDLVESGTTATDRAIVGRAIDEIRRHDESAGEQPLFTFVSTYSTHYPFRLPEDAGETPVPAADGLRAQYRQVLRYTDRQLGLLLAFLSRRARRERTVTIVLGDHGFYTDLRRTSGLPRNDNVWTTAIIEGPAELVGPPRRIVEPASHVDMLPTILSLVDDRRPTASLGSDLFGVARGAGRNAVAIRPGGLRYDTPGDSLVIDARAPNVGEHGIAFPLLEAHVLEAPVLGARFGVKELTDLVNDWSYLIERNRVWSDALIARSDTKQ
jgi:phosphoglycerol transferase MdoB-like AlkP superfamily enzyme